MVGIIQATRWFCQKVEYKLTKPPRMWDRELNRDIRSELSAKIVALDEAIDVGIGQVQACVEIATCCLMLAYNYEKKLGEPPEQAKKKKA